MMLLPEDAQKAATAALNKLVAEVGYTTDEGEAILASLSETLHTSLATFVKEKEDQCEALVAELPALVSKLDKMCAVLQAAHPAPSIASDGDMRVVPRHRELTKGLEALKLSGTKFRKMLRAGEDIPEWFAFKSVVDVLRAEWK